MEDDPHEEERERSYTKIITRSFEDAFEESLIQQAEAIYPPRDSLVAAVLGMPEDSIPNTKYWWYGRSTGTLFPYAITGDAVAYYSGRIDTLAAQATSFIITAELEYRADVSFESSYTVEGKSTPVETFEQVYVVSMHLDWDQHCGFNCAMGFRAKRVVVFDKEGVLIKVFFDGIPPVTLT